MKITHLPLKIHLTDSITVHHRLKSVLVLFVNFADSVKYSKNSNHHQYSTRLLISTFH